MLQNAIKKTIKSIRGMSDYCLELNKIGDKIIDDKILCVFSYYEDFRTFNISTLVYVDYKNDEYILEKE